ncbi:cupin domain-containing protein [Tautonia rosea]|uniref:hypothetical protein n=1 Tax=Tautonia rosea TaxID=2728037 RepID=UPI0014761476|nr:hypothetical protein [Tautonia rosea]
MTCREVERYWELRLDEVRSGSSPEVSEGIPSELASHLSVCARCRTRVAGCSTLAQAIIALEPPRPPADLSARVLAAVQTDRAPGTLPMRPVRRGSTPIVRRCAMAAAVLLVVFGLRSILSPRELVDLKPNRLPPPAAPVMTVDASSRRLTESVAEMAEVTVALARRTSEPAARLGREMLESATESSSRLEATVPKTVEGPTDGMVKGIGTRLEAGMRPFSQPTRSAFSFLVPSFPPAEDPSIPGRGV